MMSQMKVTGVQFDNLDMIWCLKWKLRGYILIGFYRHNLDIIWCLKLKLRGYILIGFFRHNLDIIWCLKWKYQIQLCTLSSRKIEASYDVSNESYGGTFGWDSIATIYNNSNCVHCPGEKSRHHMMSQMKVTGVHFDRIL